MLLNNNTLKEKIKNKLTSTFHVEEYFYKYGSNSLVHEDSLEKSKNTREIFDYNYTDFPISLSSTILTDDDIFISKNEIEIGLSSKNAKPFTLFEDSKMIKYVDKDAEKCNVFKFNIKTVAKSVNSTNVNIHNEHIYTQEFKYAVNESCYIYIVNLLDGKLPIIYISDIRIGVNNIAKYIFDKKAEIYRGFTSYYLLYSYTFKVCTEYEAMVFTEPSLNLKFEEVGAEKYYSNSDGIIGLHAGTVDVMFNDFHIGSYNIENQNDPLNIKAIKIFEDMDIFNPLYKVSEVTEFEGPINTYIDAIKNGIGAGLDVTFEQIDPDDVNKLEIFRYQYMYDDSSEIQIIIWLDHDEVFHIYTKHIYPDGENTIIYTCGINEYDYFEYSSGSSDPESFYVCTKNRMITRDPSGTSVNLKTKKDDYYIRADKSSCVVADSKNNFVGEMLPEYNIFGIPTNI